MLVRSGRIASSADRPLRRVVDVVIATVALVLLIPVFCIVAVLVVLDFSGPVIYAQQRIGKGGRPFSLLKFRSMVVDAGGVGPAVSGHNDSRVTPIGRYLRRSKLDELPQVVNILRGEMTLIGPRAEVARYVEHYSDSERGVLMVRPGLTGPGQLWFTAQAYELDESEHPERQYVERQLHTKLALDLDYLRNRTLTRDIAVIGETLIVVLRLLCPGGVQSGPPVEPRPGSWAH